MTISSSSTSVRQHLFLALALLAGVAGAAGVYLWSAGPQVEPAPVPVQAKSSGPVRFGPGEWTAPGASTPAAVTGADGSVPPPGLAAGPDQQLLINRPLREVFDYFLLSGQNAERAARADELRAYLKTQLPAPAYDTAERILRQYLAYIDEHDQVLARQGFTALSPDAPIPPQEVARLAAWQQQRSRLRQNLLGARVAQAWYQDEEQQLSHAVAELQGMAPQPAEEDSNSIRERRLHGEQQDRLRDQHNRETAAWAERSFATQRDDAHVWQQHYQAYRRALELLMQQVGMDEGEREQKIAELRLRNFPTEAERMRAIALGI